jgi:hypothetical protein
MKALGMTSVEELENAIYATEGFDTTETRLGSIGLHGLVQDLCQVSQQIMLPDILLQLLAMEE